jgi:hypothetical protein
MAHRTQIEREIEILPSPAAMSLSAAGRWWEVQ